MSSSICTVRTAGQDDLAKVLEVHARLGDDVCLPSIVPTDLQRQTWMRMMDSNELTIYLAEVDNEAVGTATLMVMPNITYGCDPTAFIEAVVVAHGRRRRGIATMIMRRVLDDARTAGCNKVQLLSHKRHATDGAHRLYTALGFEPEAEGFRLYLRNVPGAVLAARGLIAQQR